MHEFPTAYVIPVGEGQRNSPEANRLVDWLLFNGIEVRQLRFDSVILDQGVEEGLVRRRHGAGPRGLAETALEIGVDISARIGILYAPPAAWSHGYLGRRRAAGAERRAVHGEDDLADPREARRPRRQRRRRTSRVLRSSSTRRRRCGR